VLPLVLLHMLKACVAPRVCRVVKSLATSRNSPHSAPPSGLKPRLWCSNTAISQPQGWSGCGQDVRPVRVPVPSGGIDRCAGLGPDSRALNGPVRATPPPCPVGRPELRTLRRQRARPAQCANCSPRVPRPRPCHATTCIRATAAVYPSARRRAMGLYTAHRNVYGDGRRQHPRLDRQSAV
jgi:hypothetical protein